MAGRPRQQGGMAAMTGSGRQRFWSGGDGIGLLVMLILQLVVVTTIWIAD